MLLFSSISAYGQDNYKPGYVITNSLDTIRGYLLNVNTNPYKECSFKKSLNENVVVYSPDQIYGYRFEDNGKFYISKDTPVDKSMKRYFLEYMIQGKANIYLRTDQLVHYYIETARYKMMEISETEKYSRTKLGDVIVRPKLYTGKLKYVLSDCPEVFDEIDKLKLYPTQIIKLAEDYHNHVCTGEKCIIYEKKIQPLKINWGIVAGTSYNKFYFNDESYTYYQFNGFVGLNVEIENAVFSFEKLSLKTGVNIQQFNKFNFYNNNYSSYYGNSFNSQINFKSYAIINPITLNYSFPLNKFVPYIGAGISNMFILSQNNDLYILDYDYKTFYGSVLPKYHLGYEGAVGLKYILNQRHYLNLEFNYQNFHNFNMNEKLIMNTIYYSCQLGYSF